MANGRRDWWNQGQQMPEGKMSTADIVSQLAEWGGQMATLAEKGKKDKRNHFLNMADAMTRGLENEFDNTRVQPMLDKLESFYNNRADKYDLDTKDMFEVYRDKLKNQMSENVEFDERKKRWADFSQDAETFISDMFAYSNEKLKGNQNQFIDDDIAYKTAKDNDEISAYASAGNKQQKYERWQEENMKKIMEDFAGHRTEFEAKFYDRMPPSIMESMGNTEFYMQDILRGWREDQIIDAEEYGVTSNMVKSGDKGPLLELRQRRADITRSQIQNTNATLANDVKRHNELKMMYEGKVQPVPTNLIQSYFTDQQIPEYVGLSNVVEETSIPYSWWIGEEGLEKLEKGSTEYIKAETRNDIAERVWGPTMSEISTLETKISEGDEIMRNYGVTNSLETLGFNQILSGSEQEAIEVESNKEESYKEIQNMIEQSSQPSPNMVENFDTTQEMVNHIITGYKGENKFKWIQEIMKDVPSGPPSQRDKVYKQKLKYIMGLTKKHGNDWINHYNESLGGELILDKKRLIKELEAGVQNYNMQQLEILREKMSKGK